MSGTAAFKVFRAVLYTAYFMVASILAIACWTAFIHEAFREKGSLRPSTVIEDIVHSLSGHTPTALASLSNWLRTEADTVGLVSIAAFVASLVFLTRQNKQEVPAWFGAPTAFIALAVFWEVQPDVALWIGTAGFAFSFVIGGFIELWESRWVCGPERISLMGYQVMNWIFTTAGLVAAPIHLVYELKKLRATEAHAAPV